MTDQTTTPAPEPTDPDWGPSVSGGRRRRRGRVALVLVLLLLLPIAWGAALGLRASGSIDRIAVDGLQPGGGPLHVLVTGSDSREDLTPEEQQELGTGFVEGERTDSIFLLTIDGSRAGLLAFPRDLFVTRCDGSQGRINGALAQGGPSCLVQTVQAVSGIDIDHYVTVSFGGFRDVVDAVGGVELCLPEPLNDPFAGVDLPAGCQRVTGPQALGYVRTRKLDNDLERIKRQQAFLGALADELASPSLALDPVASWRLTGAIGSALTADDGLGPVDLGRLGLGLRGLASGAVTATVPTDFATIGGASVLTIREAEAQAVFAGFRDGSALRTAASDLSRADVRVRVENGAGIAGLAGTTRDLLVAEGFTVTGVGDAELRSTTVLRFVPADRPAAELLAGAIGVPITLEEASTGELTLVLGEDAADLAS